MTRPLKTYDPNWKTRWDVLEREVLALQRGGLQRPDDKGRYEALVQQQLEVFYAQFRTTGDYAAWMQDSLVRYAQANGLAGFRGPQFRPEASIAETQAFYNHATVRVEREADGRRNLLPLAYPRPGQPFGLSSAPAERIVLSGVTMQYNDLIQKAEAEPLPHSAKTIYSYAAQSFGKSAHVCLFDMRQEGPSAEQFIEPMATQIYRTRFAATAPNPVGKPLSADKVNFFIYLPPYVAGQEKLYKVNMAWTPDRQIFRVARFEPQDSVPFALRRLAAVEGVAPMPVAAQPKPAKLTWLQRWRLKGP